MTRVSLRWLDTGYCTAHESVLLPGAPHRTIRCHALVGLLHHSDYGWGLWDTGYAPRMLTATDRMPWRWYRAATPLHIRPEQAVAAQLPALGLHPADIRWVLLSHLHADHVAGLRDFPTAQVFVSRQAADDLRGRRGLNALRRAILPALFPDDWEARIRTIDTFVDAPLPGLGPTHDLFGDGSVRLVPLPGHACGQIGALVATEAGEVLLAADGAWHRRAIRDILPPRRVTFLFADAPAQIRPTLARLHAFAAARPDVPIVPTHCPEAFEELGLAD